MELGSVNRATGDTDYVRILGYSIDDGETSASYNLWSADQKEANLFKDAGASFKVKRAKGIYEGSFSSGFKSGENNTYKLSGNVGVKYSLLSINGGSLMDQDFNVTPSLDVGLSFWSFSYKSSPNTVLKSSGSVKINVIGFFNDLHNNPVIY